MTKHLLLTGFLALTLGGCMCGHRHEGSMRGAKHEKEGTEVKMTLDQLPPAVKATVQKEAEGGTISEAEKETKGGKTAYEVDATINGKPYVISVAEDGTLIAKKLKQPKQKGEEKEE